MRIKQGVAMAVAVLGSIPAAGDPLATSVDGDRIVVTSPATLEGDCWEAVTGASDQFVLRQVADSCLDTIGLPVTVVSFIDDRFEIAGQEAPVSRVLSPAGWLEPADAIGEQGPFLLVVENGARLVRAASIGTDRVPPNGEAFACDPWPTDGDVVVDLDAGSVVRAPRRSVVLPNQGLVVHVCRRPGTTVSAVWGGTRGMTRSTIDGGNHGEGRNGVSGKSYATLRFPPRTAGSADLQLFTGTDTSGTPQMEVQLEVEPLYWGSVRFGLGTLFGAWKKHELRTFAGSQQQEVRESDEGASFELVSGFAPYLVELIAQGGRSQSGGFNVFVAPYVGFGVVGNSADKGLEALTSFHAGLEVEIASDFSIAVTGVYRKTRRLADGYEDGSPIATGMSVEDVTTSTWQWGLAVVVNASPDFLQFATGTSSSGGDE